MADTIESFVAKIQSEGVEAGKQQAEQIIDDAKTQARQTVEEARQQAEKIVADAKKQAEDNLDRGRTELRLAARDVVLKLRGVLSDGLNTILAHGAQEPLKDLDWLGSTLHDLVVKTVEADLQRKDTITIDVQPEVRDKLVDWAIKEMGQQKVEHLRSNFHLRGTLKKAGFEYNATGATVEVTVDSVVDALEEIVSPRLKEILDEAFGDDADLPGDGSEGTEDRDKNDTSSEGRES